MFLLPQAPKVDDVEVITHGISCLSANVSLIATRKECYFLLCYFNGLLAICRLLTWNHPFKGGLGNGVLGSSLKQTGR